MSTKSIRLIAPGFAPNTATELLLIRSRERARIDYAHAFNIDSVTRTLTLYLVPSGEVAGDVNRIDDFPILAGEGLSLWKLLGKRMNGDDAIYWECDAADQVNLHLDGVITTEG